MLTPYIGHHLDGTVQIVRILRNDIIPTYLGVLFPIFILLFLDWKVSFLFFIILTLQFVFNKWCTKKVRHYRKNALKVYKELTNFVAEHFYNIFTIKLSGRKKEFSNDVLQLAEKEEKLFRKRHVQANLGDSVRLLIQGFCFFLIFIYSLSIEDREKSIELLILSSLFITQLLSSTLNLLDVRQKYDEHKERVLNTLELLNGGHAEQVEEKNIKISNDIKIKNLNFKYDEKIVFDNLSLNLESNSKNVIIGESGAGKTTLVNLLLKFFSINSGDITIGGTSIHKISQEQLINKISYASQSPEILNVSIKDNILFFNPTASEEELNSAINVSGLKKTLENIEGGIDYIPSEQGKTLSGGQKQRIAIARAILKKSDLYIFDEITSSIDHESSLKIIQEITHYLSSSTLIFITHNKSIFDGSVYDFYQIENGKIDKIN